MKQSLILLSITFIAVYFLTDSKYFSCLNPEKGTLMRDTLENYLSLTDRQFSFSNSESSFQQNRRVNLFKARVGDKKSKSGKKIQLFVKLNQNKQALSKTGSFELNVSEDSINIVSRDSIGIYYAFDEIEKSAEFANNHLKKGHYRFEPRINKRFLHLVMMENENVGKMKKYLDYARYYHYNYVIFQMKNHVSLNSMKGIAKPNSWTKEQFQEVIDYARSYNLSVVPEVKFLSHQNAFISDKKLLYNQHTYDPRNDEVYKAVFPIIDELIEMCQPEYFHIGHDELAGLWKAKKKGKLEDNEAMLPTKLFLKDVKKLDNYIQNKQVKTMMWGDAFLMHSDFPKMNPKAMNANASYRSLINKIPRDIVICDWRYFDHDHFESTAYFREKGFTTFGASWWKPDCVSGFTEFMANQVPYEESGLISTTWEGALTKLSEEEGTKYTIQSIARKSGDLMWKKTEI